MATITDTFNRANSATALGTTSDGTATWTAVAGTWGINTNQAYLPTPAGGSSLAVIDTGASNGDIQVTVGGTMGANGLSFRVQDGSNFLFLEYLTATTVLRARTVVAGSFATITSATVTVVAGDTIGISLSGPTISIKHSGTIVATGSDSTFQSLTKHGLYDGSGGSVARWDDWSFTPAAAVPWRRPPITTMRTAVRRASVI